MSHPFRVDPDTGLVVLRSDGAFAYEAWEAAVTAILGEIPQQTSRRRFLSDRRRVTSVQSFMMAERMLAFFRKHAEALGDMQWALVASDRTQMHEIMRLGEVFTSGTRVRVKAFTELDPALRWLLGVFEEEEITRLLRWIDEAP